MRFIVGVDFKDRCQGALRLCRWVLDRKQGDRVEALHVMQEQDLRPLLPHVSLAEVERLTRESFEAQLKEEGLRDRVSAVELVFDLSAERALTRRVGDGSDTVVVVGRRAPRGSTGFTRLGKVARRLVRSLPAPVIVVPPDYQVDHDGPVVLATSLRSDAEGTARFAARIARDWGRPLLVVHVIPGAAGSPPRYLPQKARDEVTASGRLDAEHGLTIWKRRHGLRDAEAMVDSGDVVDRITGLAFERRASLIVVGSRQLSLRARVYRSSVGSDLAGSATVPVAVVPPPATR